MSHFQDGTLVDTYLYEKNIQGDVVAVYDYAGDLVVRYAYNAWGAVSETEYGSEYDEESFEVLCNPFRYRGYYYAIQRPISITSTADTMIPQLADSLMQTDT